MHRRLNLLKTLEENFPQAKEMNNYQNIIFPAIFSLEVNLLKKDLGILELILTAIMGKFDVNKPWGPEWKGKDENVYVAILEIKSNKNLKITDEGMMRICPTQYKLVTKILDKFPIEMSESTRIVFKNPLDALNEEIFLTTPALFLEQASDEFI